MFAPMKEYINILRKYEFECKEHTMEEWHSRIDELKDNWEKANNGVYDMRSEILELKSKEQASIKKNSKDLKEKIRTFREEFKANNPFNVMDISKEVIEKSYDTVDS